MAEEDDKAALPFRDRPARASVEIPTGIGIAIGIGMAIAVGIGLITDGGAAARLVRAIFFGSAFGYFGVSVIDFGEHFRLERIATGRWYSATVIPIGETVNHLLTVAVLVALLGLARPLPPALAARDWIVLAALAAFLALGWRDELVYHRRRSVHREDIMHTVAHLAAGVMLSSFVVMRLCGY